MYSTVSGASRGQAGVVNVRSRPGVGQQGVLGAVVNQEP